MYNIIAYNPVSKQNVIVENFVETKDKKKSLDYWKENGMSFVTYKCKRSLLMHENVPSNIVDKLKRDGHLHRVNSEPFIKHI